MRMRFNRVFHANEIFVSVFLNGSVTSREVWFMTDAIQTHHSNELYHVGSGAYIIRAYARI